MRQQEYNYYAFISYNSKDTEWGKRVQRKLEHYRMPATLCSEHGWERTPIKPVFFAPTDIQLGGLSEELQERLRASKNLIVICSPNSAQSEWVGKEIAFFHQLGRTKQIHFFIVEGKPHSGEKETECFNPVIKSLGLPEILGANIHEKIYRWPRLNKERAYVQLISKLLGVEFDAIWQRHKRLLVRKMVAWTIGILVVLITLLGVWLVNQPIDVEIKLNEASAHNNNLPPLKDAVVTLSLDNESKTDTIYSLDSQATFSNIPHHYINSKVRVTVDSHDFLKTDTTVFLTKKVLLNVYRDSQIYGNVHFRLWNPYTEQVMPNTKVVIADQQAISDEEGRISLFVPLESQQKKYSVTAQLALETDTIYMPCGNDDVIIVEYPVKSSMTK